MHIYAFSLKPRWALTTLVLGGFTMYKLQYVCASPWRFSSINMVKNIRFNKLPGCVIEARVHDISRRDNSIMLFAITLGPQPSVAFTSYIELNWQACELIIYIIIIRKLIISDLIALPDFSHGAMENWGLITFRETTMLYDARRDNLDRKQNVAVIVGHELAHQVSLIGVFKFLGETNLKILA